ncbi:MAG: hypothetical protein ACXVYV_06630 [Gaiellales bacterium]
MTTHEFWRERATGHIWAVELDDGLVSACCGPLGHDDVDERFLDAFEYSPQEAPAVERRRDEFELVNAAIRFVPPG